MTRSPVLNPWTAFFRAGIFYFSHDGSLVANAAQFKPPLESFLELRAPNQP
jgi:hypothetical protein